MDNLVKFEKGNLVIEEKVLTDLQSFYVLKAQMEMKEKELKKAIMSAMEKNDVKSFNNDIVSINYVNGSEKEVVDVDKLKDEGLFDTFKKTSFVKPSVRIVWK